MALGQLAHSETGASACDELLKVCFARPVAE